MSLIASTLALAGVGLTLAHAVLFAHHAPSPPRRWTPVDLLIQAAGLGALLLAIALETRRRPPCPPSDHRLDTYKEGSR